MLTFFPILRLNQIWILLSMLILILTSNILTHCSGLTMLGPLHLQLPFQSVPPSSRNSQYHRALIRYGSPTLNGSSIWPATRDLGCTNVLCLTSGSLLLKCLRGCRVLVDSSSTRIRYKPNPNLNLGFLLPHIGCLAAHLVFLGHLGCFHFIYVTTRSNEYSAEVPLGWLLCSTQTLELYIGSYFNPISFRNPDPKPE